METNGTNDTCDLRPRHTAGCNPGVTHSTSAAATIAALVEGSAEVKKLKTNHPEVGSSQDTTTIEQRLIDSINSFDDSKNLQLGHVLIVKPEQLANVQRLLSILHTNHTSVSASDVRGNIFRAKFGSQNTIEIFNKSLSDKLVTLLKKTDTHTSSKPVDTHSKSAAAASSALLKSHKLDRMVTNPSSAHDGNEAAAAAAKAKALRQKNLASAQQPAKVTRQLTEEVLERFTNFNNVLKALDIKPLPKEALDKINTMRHKKERTGHTFEQYEIDTNYQGSQLKYIKQKFPTDAEIVEIFCSDPFLKSELEKKLTARGIQVKLPESWRLNLGEFNLQSYQLFIKKQDYYTLLGIDLPTYPEPENLLLQQTQSDRPNIAPSTTACRHRTQQTNMEKIIYDWVHEQGITPEDTDCRKALANKIIPKEDHLEATFDIDVCSEHPSFPYLTSLPVNLRTKQVIVLDGFTALKSLPEGLKCKTLYLTNCPLLEKLPEDLDVRLNLVIKNCPLLETLPNVLKVRTVIIKDCPSLETLPNFLKVEKVVITGENEHITPESIQSYQREPGFVNPKFLFLKE